VIISRSIVTQLTKYGIVGKVTGSEDRLDDFTAKLTSQEVRGTSQMDVLQNLI